MKTAFNSANPRERARPFLDRILERGVDQIAIACAFLTGGGVEALRPHVARLRLPDSFVVVAWAPPTTLDSVQELYALIPGKLYLHLGAETPFEKRVGPGLMHSKVFFARAGNDCWLWTGSHNLTASAAQGVNCEAAIVLEGTIDEMPFQEALAHLNQCRAEAVIFDPYHPPPPPHPEPTLIIHAESDVALKACPWFVHMRPSTTRYDALMGPPGDVWIFLYSPGSLRVGRSANAVGPGTGWSTAPGTLCWGFCMKVNGPEHHATIPPQAIRLDVHRDVPRGQFDTPHQKTAPTEYSFSGRPRRDAWTIDRALEVRRRRACRTGRAVRRMARR